MASRPIQVIINPISAQFEAVRCSEAIGILAYERVGTHFDLQHTFVPRRQRGTGVAEELVAAVLDAIRSTGGTITPSCSYVSAFVRAHPGYASLVAPGPLP